MASKRKDNEIVIDGKSYDLTKLSQESRDQIANIQFCDAQIAQLNNEWAVADTARIGYTKALKGDVGVTSVS